MTCGAFVKELAGIGRHRFFFGSATTRTGYHRLQDSFHREPLKIHISSQLLRCVKNFLLTYNPYAALRNFSRALHLGEL
jgi:hypothetical protein